MGALLTGWVKIKCERCGRTEPVDDIGDTPIGWHNPHPTLCPFCNGRFMKEVQPQTIADAMNAVVKAINDLIVVEVAEGSATRRYVNINKLAKMAGDVTALYKRVSSNISDLAEEAEDDGLYPVRLRGGDTADMNRELMMMAQKQIENTAAPRALSPVEELAKLSGTLKTLKEYGISDDGVVARLKELAAQIGATPATPATQPLAYGPPGLTTTVNGGL